MHTSSSEAPSPSPRPAARAPRLTLASLFLAAQGTALAADGPDVFAQGPSTEEASATTAEAPAAAPLEARWSATRRDGVLEVTLKVRNASQAPVDIVSSRGSQPGASGTATVAGQPLERLWSKAELSSEMSRMGPMPHHTMVAVGSEVNLGTFRFKLPETASTATVSMQAGVWTDGTLTTVVTTLPAGPQT